MEERVFTEHVRSLLAGEPIDGEKIILHLRKSITRHLKRMGQWNRPPRYLGYVGCEQESWSKSDALDDLVQDAYLTCVFHRMKKLAEHLQASGSIEGFVHWKLKRFLLDGQRKGNPIGLRVFNNVKAASESLVEAGRAETLNVDRLRSATIILAVGKPQPTSTDQLADCFVKELSDQEFLRAITSECVASWRLIENTILNKFESGLTGYKIGDLVNLLTDSDNHPREVAEPISADDKGVFDDLFPDVRTLSPEGRYQQREDFEEVHRTLTEHAQETIRNARIQARVIRMLDYLAELIRDGEDPRQLTQAEMARRLAVSKSTLNEDIARLRQSNEMQDASEKDTEL